MLWVPAVAVTLWLVALSFMWHRFPWVWYLGVLFVGFWAGVFMWDLGEWFRQAWWMLWFIYAVGFPFYKAMWLRSHWRERVR